MFRMYSAYVLTLWLILGGALLYGLPTTPNPGGLAIFYFLIAPGMIVCFSGELLICLSKEQKRALAQALAAKQITWHQLIIVGIVCAVAAAVVIATVWTITGVLFWDSLVSMLFDFLATILVLVLSVAAGMAYLIVKTKKAQTPV